VKQSVILDTGPLVAAINSRDTHHHWVVHQLLKIKPPLITCESDTSYHARYSLIKDGLNSGAFACDEKKFNAEAQRGRGAEL
jgi:hypothetical protein